MADHSPSDVTYHDLATSNNPESLITTPTQAQDDQNVSRASTSDRDVPLQDQSTSPADSDHDIEKKGQYEDTQTTDTIKNDPTITPRRKSSAPLDVLATITKAEAYHPINWPTWKKWLIAITYCVLELFVTLTSTTYVSVEFLIQAKFGGSTQVITLGQSMFIVGTAVGPAFLGPLSDIGGRKYVYVGSILLYAILNIGTALAINLPMLIVFSFLIGLAGSTALSNVAGTIADLFGDSDGAGQPMALFVLGANSGPSLGSPIGEWIGNNPHMGWRWIYYINIIIGGVFAFALCFVPETLPRVVIAREVKRRGSVGVDQHEVDIAAGSEDLNILKEIRFIATMALRIMVTEPIVIFLALYNGFTFGMLFLYLDGVFDVFAVNNNLSYVNASLTYLNVLVGSSLLFCFVPVQTYFYKRDRARHNGKARPEARFLTSLVVVWLFPAALFWFAFTSEGNVSYWSPLIAGLVLNFADPLLWLSMLTYITDSYPNVAASAIAAFLIPSFIIAAGLCHAGVEMFANMSTKWAFATLGFISIGIVVLVYVLFFFGSWLRGKSRLASGGGTPSQLLKKE